MNILVLGSEGFIGSHLVDKLAKGTATVVGCDLFETARNSTYRYIKVSRLSPQWEEIFSSSSFDFCINAAGSGNVLYSMQHPLIDFEANTLDVIRILDSIRKLAPKCRYLHISSAAVYGNPDILPIMESAISKPMSPYGWHKLMSETICREYYNIFGIRTVIIRPFSVYGDGLKKQLLWDICKRLHSENSIELFGTGTESRDFIHVSDLVNLILILINKGTFCADIFNAASGVETTIGTIAQYFEAFYKGKKKISFSGQTRTGDPNNWRADISLISELGFKCEKPLESGIREYIDWFHSQSR